MLLFYGPKATGHGIGFHQAGVYADDLGGLMHWIGCPAEVKACVIFVRDARDLIAGNYHDCGHSQAPATGNKERAGQRTE